MPFVTPASVSPGDSYTAAAHNIIVGDVNDLDSRVTTNATYLCPVGMIAPYVATAAPSGWLVCDGSQVSQSTYAALYAVIGVNKFGTDTGGNFYLPDLQGRMPVGYAASGHSDVQAIGGNDGSVLASRRPKHKHTVNESAHTHNAVVNTSATLQDGAVAYMGRNDGGNQFSQQMTSVKTNLTVGLQASTPTDTAAYIVVNFIIKY